MVFLYRETTPLVEGKKEAYSSWMHGQIILPRLVGGEKTIKMLVNDKNNFKYIFCHFYKEKQLNLEGKKEGGKETWRKKKKKLGEKKKMKLEKKKKTKA